MERDTSLMRSPMNDLVNGAADLTSLEKLVEKALDPTTVKKLKSISFYLSEVGLTFEEACLLSRIRPQDASILVNKYPALKELLTIKELQFKAAMLSTVSKRAKDGNDKQANWLLERRYPLEFSEKAKKAVDPVSADKLSVAINFIRNSANNEENMPVNKDAGKPTKVYLDGDTESVFLNPLKDMK